MRDHPLHPSIDFLANIFSVLPIAMVVGFLFWGSVFLGLGYLIEIKIISLMFYIISGICYFMIFVCIKEFWFDLKE